MQLKHETTIYKNGKFLKPILQIETHTKDGKLVHEIIREMHKATLRYLLLPIRMPAVKKERKKEKQSISVSEDM